VKTEAAIRAEQKLRDSEERIRGILHTAVEGIITIDARGIMESVNPAAEKMFGYKQEELIGRNVSMLMPSPYREEHDGYLTNYLNTNRPKIIGIGREVVGQRKDGSIFPMYLSVGEVNLRGERLFTGIVRDITEQKRLEQEILEIAGREQRRIGHDLHDDLCQRLTAIELMSERCGRKLEKKAVPEAGDVEKIAEQLRETIAQTRMLARGLSPVEVEANGLMSALTELATNTEKRFQIACEFRCDDAVLIEDNVAATHLYRIVQEAINNALRHGQAKHLVIALSGNGDAVELTITDDGVGFPKKPNAGGMGLQIMKYRASVIGGTLDVQRANPRGTRVTCSFRKTRPMLKR
jgi:two-component system sensor kinase FixL